MNKLLREKLHQALDHALQNLPGIDDEKYVEITVTYPKDKQYIGYAVETSILGIESECEILTSTDNPCPTCGHLREVKTPT